MSDRKYRQPGYQSDDRKGETRGPAPRPGGPREAPLGPRGRGLGKPTVEVFRCSTCGTRQEGAQILPASTCVKCRADLHTCRNCISFDIDQHWECRRHAELPARVAKKTARNECVLFQAKVAMEQETEVAGARDARSAFDALFKI